MTKKFTSEQELRGRAKEHHDVAKSFGSTFSRDEFVQAYQDSYPLRAVGSIIPSDFAFNSDQYDKERRPSFLEILDRATYRFVGLKKGQAEKAKDTSNPKAIACSGQMAPARTAPLRSAAQVAHRSKGRNIEAQGNNPSARPTLQPLPQQKAKTSAHEFICATLDDLSTERPVFHSEADFQLALAVQLQIKNPRAAVRCEVPFRRPAADHMDIVMTTDEGPHGIELKFLPLGVTYETEVETYQLASGVRDVGRYGILRDISRIEAFGRGTVIAVSNDPGMWSSPRADAIDAPMSLAHGHTLSTEPLFWAEHASPGSYGKREPLTISGGYTLDWRPYSDLGGKRGEFRALIIEVA